MKLTKRTLAFLCTLIMVLQLFSGLSLASAEEAQVWNAMTNEEVAGLRTYSGASTTRGAKEVTIEGGVITSEVTDAMKWTPVTPEGAQEKGYDGEPQFFLTDSTGKYLRRGSMGNSTATLALETSIVINSTVKNIRYYTFSTHSQKHSLLHVLHARICRFGKDLCAVCQFRKSIWQRLPRLCVWRRV